MTTIDDKGLSIEKISECKKRLVLCWSVKMEKKYTEEQLSYNFEYLTPEWESFYLYYKKIVSRPSSDVLDHKVNKICSYFDEHEFEANSIVFAIDNLSAEVALTSISRAENKIRAFHDKKIMEAQLRTFASMF